MQELVKPKRTKTRFKPLSKFSVNALIIVGSLFGAYLFGSFNPIQELIPIEINRTEESVSIELKFK